MPKGKTSMSKLSQLSIKEITDRAQADAVFQSIGDGAITTDEFGRITRVNPAAEKMLEYKEKDLLGKPYLKTFTAQSLDGQQLTIIDRPMTRSFLTGNPIQDRLIIQTKSGAQIPVSVNISPIIVERRPIGAIEILRDISIELEIDRMKSEFISLASHQLRTPLSAIKTYSHMLSDEYMGKLNPDQKESIETIISATNRMNELISTLLNITRIESGTIAVNPKLINMVDVLNEILPELKLIAESKNIKINTKLINKMSSQLRTDSLIVKEVVNNIVSNAIKYSPAGSQIEVQIKPRRNDILLVIIDSGWGIPDKAQDKVFSKFFRGSNIIRRETSGTGLGLYLVKGLIDTLNGQIWFQSEEGKGTTFYVSLPRKYSGKKFERIVKN